MIKYTKIQIKYTKISIQMQDNGIEFDDTRAYYCCCFENSSRQKNKIDG